MSIVTQHWSATTPRRIRDYHVEYALTGTIGEELRAAFLAASGPSAVAWDALRQQFSVWKNFSLSRRTDYGTWHLNSDPRDRSPNIEIGALCMGGEDVCVSGKWGKHPFTIAHAWMAVGIGARICKLKNLDPIGSFKVAGYQNGAINVLSTHAERALQTPDPLASLRPNYGYFIYSGDPECRWDLAVLDHSHSPLLATPESARAQALESAAWLRKQTAAALASGITDYWGLDR